MTMDMITELSLRLGTALLLGGVIGVEREWRSKDAGFRTHFLVALGSALFCIVSEYGFGGNLRTRHESRRRLSPASDFWVPEPSSSKRM